MCETRAFFLKKNKKKDEPKRGIIILNNNNEEQIDIKNKSASDLFSFYLHMYVSTYVRLPKCYF